MKLSIVLPIYNEEDNLRPLYEQLMGTLNKLDINFEVICVNDGSSDKSFDVLKDLADKDQRIKIVNFKNNFGQTAAMSAGIKESSGEIIIPMDADLQNDPVDIPRFLEKIKDGYDVVSGWRKNRQDKAISRRLPSVIANWIIGRITGVRIHDYGCSMKAYKRDIIKGVNLYGEMHRFIPAYASWQGAKVTEMVVNHHPRIHGVTKYGIGRTFKVILDLIVVKFLSVYMNRPIHFFGGLGFVSLFFGILTGLTAIALRIFEIKYIVETPLPTLAALLVIVGVQLIAMGILAEMIMRTYYESQHKEPYIIKDKINFDN